MRSQAAKSIDMLGCLYYYVFEYIFGARRKTPCRGVFSYFRVLTFRPRPTDAGHPANYRAVRPLIISNYEPSGQSIEA